MSVKLTFLSMTDTYIHTLRGLTLMRSARSQYMLTVTVSIDTITTRIEVIANLSLFDPGAGSYVRGERVSTGRDL